MKDILNEHETDFYKRIQYWNGTAKYIFPDGKVYEKYRSDWYFAVAVEKANKVKEDRHLLTYDLIVRYRHAIREGFGHQLDPNLRNEYDHPRNRNTIKGIRGYIDKIFPPES
ncbi:hypothetical protein [Spongiimicrobium salis]|uniref:hypothetical protein n=1 Tax=Spongiimicrobium salis TaxID=1667022 RepID=UPI00374D98B1